MTGSEMSSQHGAKGNLIQGANHCGVKPEPPGRDMTQVPQPPLPQTHSSCIQFWAAFSYRDHPTDMICLCYLSSQLENLKT